MIKDIQTVDLEKLIKNCKGENSLVVDGKKYCMLLKPEFVGVPTCPYAEKESVRELFELQNPKYSVVFLCGYQNEKGEKNGG